MMMTMKGYWARHLLSVFSIAAVPSGAGGVDFKEFGRLRIQRELPLLKDHLHKEAERKTRVRLESVDFDAEDLFALMEIGQSMSMAPTPYPSPPSTPTPPTSLPPSPFNPGNTSAAPTSTFNPTITPVPTLAPSSSKGPSVSPAPTVPPSTSEPSASMIPTISAPPTNLPTVSQQPSATPSPTVSPTIAPTLDPATPQVPESSSPTLQPTKVDVPSAMPSFEPTPTLFQEDLVFTCTDQGVVEVAQPPFEVATAIPIKVGYLIETTAFLDEFQADLEQKILETALAGALQCNGGGPVLDEGCPPVEIFTSLTGEDCTSQISPCTVLETEFRVVVNQDLNPDTAAFLGYVLLQEEMDGGVFVEELPILDRVQYLSPLPLLPPIIDPEEPSTSPPDGVVLEPDSSALSLSGWTVGAVVAMCVGGVAALWVWARNRRTRNQRHMPILEDMSMTSGQESP